MAESNQTLKVANEIVSFIAKRGYEPGERLPSERDLTARFAVGRNAIREALVFLEASRFIERRRNSGIFLSAEMGQISLETLVLSSKLGIDLDRRTIVECMEVRKILELQAVSLACERRTEQDLKALRAILARSEATLAAQGSIAELDHEFHMAIFRATQNDIFLRVVTPFYLMAHQRRTNFFADPANGLTSHAQHVELVRAIEARDAALASELMSRHIGRVEQRYLQQHDSEEKARSER
jgi:DNA-binding FadR family transcriptional regulator